MTPDEGPDKGGSNGTLSRPILLVLQGCSSLPSWQAGCGFTAETFTNLRRTDVKPTSVRETKNPVTGDSHYTFSIPTDPGEPQASGDLWKALRDALKVERIAPNEDPQQRARDAARRDFNQLNQVRSRNSGNRASRPRRSMQRWSNRLTEANDEGALKMLDGYRRLEEDPGSRRPGRDGPEERFEIVVKARRDAFGEETAEHLFFEKEAYTQYKLEEKAIVTGHGPYGSREAGRDHRPPEYPPGRPGLPGKLRELRG